MNELKIIRPHLNLFMLLKRTVVLFLFGFFFIVPWLFADEPPQKGGLTVESIQLVGNHRTRPQVIRNYILFQEGDVISRRDVTRLQVNLEESEFFKKVNVYTQPGSQRGKIQVFIEVKERKAPFFQVRGGFSQLDGWYISPIGLHFNNIFGHGHKLGAEFLIGDRVSGLTIGYMKPYIFSSEFHFGMQIIGQRRDYLHYIDGQRFDQFVNQSTFRIYLAGARGWQRYFRFAFLTTGNEADSVMHKGGSNGEETPLPPELEFVSGNRQVNRFQVSLLVDSRDTRIYPTRGFWGGLFFDQASKELGSFVNFYKLIADMRFYQKIPLNAVIAFHAEAGRVTENVPFYEKFYLGGPNSLRGYDDRSLTPPGYASHLFLGQAEVRIPLMSKNYPNHLLSGVLFYDTGYAWNDGASISLSDLYSGLGFGFRVNIPIIGVVRLDFAYPVPEYDDLHIHLSLGQTF